MLDKIAFKSPKVPLQKSGEKLVQLPLALGLLLAQMLNSLYYAGKFLMELK